MKVVLEKRLEQSLKAQIGLPVLSALMALVFCGVFFALTGKEPLLVYESMFSGALGNDYGLSETFVKMIPMALCALGIAVAFRMQIWNIGAEGQFYMGACAATWVPLNFPDLPAAVMLAAIRAPVKRLPWNPSAFPSSAPGKNSKNISTRKLRCGNSSL